MRRYDRRATGAPPHALAGSSTLNRLELAEPETAECDRYKKNVAYGRMIDTLLVDLFLDRERPTPSPRGGESDDPRPLEDKARRRIAYLLIALLALLVIALLAIVVFGVITVGEVKEFGVFRVAQLQGVFLALLIEPQLREFRDSLAVARTPLHCANIRGLGVFQSAEAVQGQTGAVGRLAVVGALFLGAAIGVERLIHPVNHGSGQGAGGSCCRFKHFLPAILFTVCFGVYVGNGDFLPGND